MKYDTMEEWKNRALQAETRAKQKDEELTRQYRVLELLCAGGFVTKEKIREAEQFLESL